MTVDRVPDIIAKDLEKSLQELIVFCDLAPGTRLREEDIVQRFKVSRSPVREALRLLAQDGLIVMASRRGARVSSISVADLDEVYICRIALEKLAAELAARNRTGDDIELMKASLDGLRAALADKNPRSFFAENVKLTHAFYQSTRNGTLQRLLANVEMQALRYRYIAYQQSPTLMDRSLEYNLEIVNAIIGQKPRHARALTEDVLENSWKNVREQIDGLSFDDEPDAAFPNDDPVQDLEEQRA